MQVYCQFMNNLIHLIKLHQCCNNRIHVIHKSTNTSKQSNKIKLNNLIYLTKQATTSSTSKLYFSIYPGNLFVKEPWLFPDK